MGHETAEARRSHRHNGAVAAAVDLWWIPLGAGGRVVALNGRAYQAIVARRQHRRPAPLFHAALEVWLDDERTAIEMAPAWQDRHLPHGAVASGPVGARWAGRWSAFRYEIRCWRSGRIPDLAFATAGPRRLSDDAATARSVLALVPEVPTPIWGRDELRTGEMWNSNSVVAWVLTRAGLDASAVTPPSGGRAPGWHAGLVVAARSLSPSRTAGSAARDRGPRDRGCTPRGRRGWC
jgi:hypothetical protein